MNERNYKMNLLLYWCLFTIFGIEICLGYGLSSNSIKDLNVKDYHLKSEDNEIRGKFN
jgi:hypothetical protein